MRKILFLLIFLLPVAILLPGIEQFAYPPGSPYSDVVISHYPNGLFLQRAINEYGQVPLWSSTILSGYPFSANPLSGLYYLPGWLALPFPLPFGFNLMVILHLLWGGAGMYLLLRAEGLDEAPALLGALIFESYPKLFAHYGAGHLTLLYAVPWTPWLLFAQRKSAGSLKPAGQLAVARMTPGLILGTIALADVRWAAYAGAAWFVYCLRPDVLPRVTLERSWQRIVQVGLGIAGNCLLAGCVAAPLLLPLQEYSSLSTRTAMTMDDNLYLSLNPAQLLGLFFPHLRAPAEWTLYPGAVAVGLFLFAAAAAPLRRRAAYWLLMAVAASLFALGSYVPPISLISNLPGLDMLRVPPRSLFLSGLGFAAVAAIAVDYLMRQLREQDESFHRQKIANLVLFAVWVFVCLIGAGVALTAESAALRLQFGWGAVIFTIVFVLMILALNQKIRAEIIWVVLMVIGIGELAAINSAGLVFRSFNDAAVESAGVASYLATQAGSDQFRVYSPSYSIPQQTAALYRLELADGIDPLQLAVYADYMRFASGVPSRAYSVTLPPFANAEPSTDNRGFMPDAERLGLLNVRYVVAEYALPGSRLRLLARFGETRIYENPFSLPRAWTQASESKPGANLTGIPAIRIQPNRIEVQNAKGPGLLILSEIDYPGWLVQVDGEPAHIEPVLGLLRSVSLEPGLHLVEFIYRPLRVFIGLAAAACAWLFVLGVAVVSGRQKRQVA